MARGMPDGIPLYGERDVGGRAPVGLDECGGHADPQGHQRPWYHYHASRTFPYSVRCLAGCLDLRSLLSINSLLAAAASSCAPAALQPLFLGAPRFSQFTTCVTGGTKVQILVRKYEY